MTQFFELCVNPTEIFVRIMKYFIFFVFFIAIMFHICMFRRRILDEKDRLVGELPLGLLVSFGRSLLTDVNSMLALILFALVLMSDVVCVVGAALLVFG